MTKLAFVFPGQGSQYVGMGQALFDNYSEAAEVYRTAAEVLGQGFVDIILNGPEDELRQTYVNQPAILTASVACLKVLESQGVRPDFVAGHSLGEYSAHVAAGTFSFPAALKIVRERGRLMQEAVPSGGAMAAILGIDRGAIQDACHKASDLGVVEIANFNCPGQVVISGQAEAVEVAMVLCKDAGAKRAMRLSVSGPFHSSLMQPAAEGLRELLTGIEISAPGIALAANIDGECVNNRENVESSLVRQVSSSVRWEECVHTLVKLGAKVFIEVGPGKVLSGLIKKISPEVGLTNVEDLASLEKSLAYLKESR